MSSNPDEPLPLVIRGCRNRVQATQDVLQWVKETSGRENDDPKIEEEQNYAGRKLQSLGRDRDAVLLLERNGAKELQVNVYRLKMSSNPDEPLPLVIRGCRNRVQATQDVIQWVKETSGRENDDPKIEEEQSYAGRKLQSLGRDRDAVLLLERNDAKELEVTVLTTATMRPTPLAIRGSRDPGRAATDIVNWVRESSGRENNDPRNYGEVTYLQEQWEALRRGDAVLFVERNDAMELQVTVLTAIRRF